MTVVLFAIHFQEMQALKESIANLPQQLDSQLPSSKPDNSAMFALESAQVILKERFVALQKKYNDVERKNEMLVASVVCILMDFLSLILRFDLLYDVSCVFGVFIGF